MSVRYVATPGAVDKIARGKEIADVVLRCAQNGANSISSLSGFKYNARRYLGRDRWRGFIFAKGIAVQTQKKVNALRSARPRL